MIIANIMDVIVQVYFAVLAIGAGLAFVGLIAFTITGRPRD